MYKSMATQYLKWCNDTAINSKVDARMSNFKTADNFQNNFFTRISDETLWNVLRENH